jgi:hypothetical protein
VPPYPCFHQTLNVTRKARFGGDTHTTLARTCELVGDKQLIGPYKACMFVAEELWTDVVAV